MMATILLQQLPMDFFGYAAYIFDFDDTLVQTYRHVLDTINPRLASRLGLRYIGGEQALALWGSEIPDFCRQAFPGVVDVAPVMKELYDLQVQDPPPVFAGSVPLLRALQRAGKVICLFTTGARPMVENCIHARLGMTPDDFALIYYTAERGVKKPTARVFTAVQNRVRRLCGQQILAEDMLLIGDSLADYRSARKRGVDFIAVASGPHTREDFLSAGLPAPWIYADIDALADRVLVEQNSQAVE